MLSSDGLISTAVLLTPDEDRVLRVEAAKAGTSKTKLAQKIIRDWAYNQKTPLTIRQRINVISKEIAVNGHEEREHLFDTLDRIVTGSCDYIEVQVKLSGVTEGNDLERKRQEVISKLNADIEIINNFCSKIGIILLTNSSAIEFAEDFVQGYFETRAK